MAQDTAIEWCDDTVNPWWGCEKVSKACKNCYAEAWDARFGGNHWGPGTERLLRVEKAIGELRRIERRAKKEGRPRRVFVASMADVFEDRADLVEPRRRLWEAMHALSGWVIPLILTKRPDVMAAWAKEHGWPKHAWAGYTVESQKRADWGIPCLLRVPASVRFLSMEPLLEEVEVDWALQPMDACCGGDGMGGCPGRMGCYLDGHPWDDGTREDGMDGGYSRVHWVIAGGESGRNARPSHPDWFRSLRDQCAAAGVPYLFKQWGAWAPAGPVYGDDEQEEAKEEAFSKWAFGHEVVALEGDGSIPQSLGTFDHRSGLLLTPDFCHYQPDASAWWMVRVGKKAAGRLLDGVEHNGVPDVAVPA